MNTPHEENLGHLCARIARALRAKMEHRTKEMGLHFSQAVILMYLHHYGASSLTEMAQHMCFAHPSVLRQVDALEKASYVERKLHEEDRRRKVIHLTASGRARVESLIEIVNDVHKQATVGFAPEELERLRADLLKLSMNLSEMETI